MKRFIEGVDRNQGTLFSEYLEDFITDNPVRVVDVFVEHIDLGKPGLNPRLLARSMATSGWGTDIVGYNVQVAVDTRYYLIVVQEVTKVGHDRNQLTNMSKQAKDALAVTGLNGQARPFGC